MTLTLRLGLSMLALIELVLGIWTLGFPESFYRDVPTVDLTPLYSEHLFRDFGGATLGLGIVLAAAAVWPETRLVIVALVAFLAFSAPHLAFHLGHLHGATPVEAVVLTSGLTALVVLPLVLIGVAAARAGRNSRTSDATSPLHP